MNAETLKIVHSGPEDEAHRILAEFNTQHSKSFTFPSLTKESKQTLLEGVLERLNTKASNKTYKTCLETIRIVSREKPGLDTLTNEQALKLLVHHAGLETYAKELTQLSENVTIQQGDGGVLVEAQKCLCNLVYNSTAAQKNCSVNGSVEGIIQRMKTYKDPDLSFDVKFFDMRLLFLITALVPDSRMHILNQLHGFTYLVEVLDLIVADCQDKKMPLTDPDVSLCNEVLKILFNLTVSVDKNNLDEEEEAHFQRLVSILHDLLLASTATKDKTEELQSHTVNLLTNMPKDSYDELLTPVDETELVAAGNVDNKEIEYDGKDMEAINVLLEFLDNRLNNTPAGNLKENLAPILHCMCEICRGNRCIRKYLRVKILPRLRDEVIRLPEDGESLRNKLTKLFTSPVTEVKDLAADLCFVLCKESVARFVKYTGYGNAAGLLAQRGLMCGGQTNTDMYSSESEDSDTEEYSELRDGINPITGRFETAKKDPMEGMTDEQKEYEAMQLVNKIDQLTRSGVIQPSRIGEDGRPVAVEHILQLTENLNPSSNVTPDEDSD